MKRRAPSSTLVADTPRFRSLVVVRNRSQRAERVVARGSQGSTSFAGTSLHSRLDLRSSWFSIGVLSLTGTARVTFGERARDRKSTRLNSSHANIPYAAFRLK